MKDKKYALASFTFYDRTGIQEYLEKQARKGWLLEKISSFRWTFCRIEPRQIHFAVTYFPKASAFDPVPTEQQRVFQEFCAHSGWTLAGLAGPLQIFYNEQESPLPIETDPMTELRTIRETAVKTYLPCYFMLLVVTCMQLAKLIGSARTSVLNSLSSNLTLFNWVSMAVLLTLCLTEIIGYFSWYVRAKKAAQESGRFVRTRGFRCMQLSLVGFETGLLAVLLFSLEKRLSLTLAISVAGIFGIILLVNWLHSWMKREGVERGLNQAATMVAAVVLSVLYTTGMVYGTMQLWRLDIWEAPAPETYMANGMQWELHHDELPLYVEDLMEPEYDRYSCKWEESGSLILKSRTGTQKSRVGESAPELEYSIYDTSIPFLYELCLEELLTEYDTIYADEVVKIAYHQVAAAPWGAETAYRCYYGSAPMDSYILCYGDRFVTLELDWPPTEDQMALIGEKLTGID